MNEIQRKDFLKKIHAEPIPIPSFDKGTTISRIYNYLRRWGLANIELLSTELKMPQADVLAILNENPPVGKHYTMREAADIVGCSYDSIRRFANILGLGKQDKPRAPRMLSESDIDKICEHRQFNTVGNPGFRKLPGEDRERPAVTQ